MLLAIVRLLYYSIILLRINFLISSFLGGGHFIHVINLPAGQSTMWHGDILL